MLGSSVRLLIGNPYASGVSDARGEQVRRVLGDVEVARTTHPGHATLLAREADAEAVYGFSGGGGLQGVLTGRGSAPPVAFIPGGGANGLPRALGLPRDPVAAAEHLSEGRTRRSAVGRGNGQALRR